MSDYIIDITIENIPEQDYGEPRMLTLYIKIDKNGNVDIRKKIVSRLPWGAYQTWEPFPFIIINDNIPIPSYLINVIKNSFSQRIYKTKVAGVGNNATDISLNYRHYLNAIENIIILKEELAKMTRHAIIDLL